MYKILIIEDNGELRLALQTLLESQGYGVSAPEDFEDVIDFTLKLVPHLIILDIDLTSCDGFQVCRELRGRSKIPIIVLTSHGDESIELMSITLGADHFVTTPYNPDVLLAKVAGLLLRAYDTGVRQSLRFGELVLDIGKGKVRYGDRSAFLTKNELRILWLLVERGGSIVSRNEMMRAIWQNDTYVDSNTLTVSVNRLRKKLREIGAEDSLRTRRGFGYCLCG
jgi:DNA-binding response OmpR family regulator